MTILLKSGVELPCDVIERLDATSFRLLAMDGSHLTNIANVAEGLPVLYPPSINIEDIAAIVDGYIDNRYPVQFMLNKGMLNRRGMGMKPPQTKV